MYVLLRHRKEMDSCSGGAAQLSALAANMSLSLSLTIAIYSSLSPLISAASLSVRI